MFVQSHIQRARLHNHHHHHPNHHHHNQSAGPASLQPIANKQSTSAIAASSSSEPQSPALRVDESVRKRPAPSGSKTTHSQAPTQEQEQEHTRNQIPQLKDKQREEEETRTNKRSSSVSSSVLHRPKSKSPKRPSNKQPTNRHGIVAATTDYHTHDQQQSTAKVSSTTASSKIITKLDGANQAAPNQQMGFRSSFQHHYKLTSALKTNVRPDRLLTYSETIQSDTTLAASAAAASSATTTTTTTIVRLRSSSLSSTLGEGDLGRQLGHLSGRHTSSKHRGTTELSATGNSDLGGCSSSPTRLVLALKYANLVDEHSARDQRQLEWPNKAEIDNRLAGLSTKSYTTTTIIRQPHQKKRYSTNKSSKEYQQKRLRSSRASWCKSRHKRSTPIQHHYSGKRLDLRLLCDFIESQKSLGHTATGVKNSSNLSSPLLPAVIRDWLNVNRFFLGTSCIATCNFSASKWLQQFICFTGLFLNHLFAFQWDTARQLLGLNGRDRKEEAHTQSLANHHADPMDNQMRHNLNAACGQRRQRRQGPASLEASGGGPWTQAAPGAVAPVLIGSQLDQPDVGYQFIEHAHNHNLTAAASIGQCQLLHHHHHQQQQQQQHNHHHHQPTPTSPQANFHVHRHNHAGHHELGLGLGLAGSPSAQHPPSAGPLLLGPASGQTTSRVPYRSTRSLMSSLELAHHGHDLQSAPFVTQVPTAAERVYFGADQTADLRVVAPHPPPPRSTSPSAHSVNNGNLQQPPNVPTPFDLVVDYRNGGQQTVMPPAYDEHTRQRATRLGVPSVSNARNDSSIWMWRMRHTVDGSPVSLARHFGMHPSSVADLQQCDLDLSNKMASAGLDRGGGLVRAGNLATSGQQATSFSSPTLHQQSDQLGGAAAHNCWPTIRPMNVLDRYHSLAQQPPLSAPFSGQSSSFSQHHRMLPTRPDTTMAQHQNPRQNRHYPSTSDGVEPPFVQGQAQSHRYNTQNHNHYQHTHQHQHNHHGQYHGPAAVASCSPLDLGAAVHYQRGLPIQCARQTAAASTAVATGLLASPLDQKILARRLSSIVGSDSELYKRSLLSTANFSSSSISSLSSGANLIKLDQSNLDRGGHLGHNYLNNHPESGQRMASSSNNRRRLNRQASSTTSEASYSHYDAYRRNDQSLRHGLVKPNQHKQRNESGAANSEGKTAHESRGAPAHQLDTGSRSVTNQQTDHHHHHQQQLQMSSNQRLLGNQRSASAIDGQQQQQQRQHQQSGDDPASQSCSGGTGSGGHPSTTSSGRKMIASLGASGKSKSMSQQHSPIGVASTLGKVSLAGAKRRLGFKQNRGLNSLSVHRSEEIFPSEASERLARQYTSTTNTTTTTTTTGSASLNDSCDLDLTSRWLGQFGSESPDPKVCFVEGLGIGQIASRQALVSPYLGDIQLSLSDRRGMLEVEIIRVRHLQPKPYAKRLPAVYVKAYLMRNKKCLAKFKTTQMTHTLDPLYQQLFIFRDDYSNCVLQIIVWGDYGKNDRKSLMGIVQIHLDDLDMSNMVVGWYKLFNAPSMVATASIASSSKSLRQTLSTTKLVDITSIPQQQ